MDPVDTPIGMHKNDLDTPALLLDIATMEQNLRRMSDFLADKSVKLRPHVKLYKATPEIAQKQIESGAIGLTCAKLSEAEGLASAGITDILIANQVVGSKKYERLMKLARRCDIIVAVDSQANAAGLAQAAQSHDVTNGVLVEVNIGHKRCGGAPFEPVLELAESIVQLKDK